MVTLTERAGDKLEHLIEEKGGGRVLRIFVKKGGCSGHSYGMKLDEDVGDMDQVMESEGIRIAVDPETLSVVDGSEIDFVESVTGGGFAIRNPQAKKTCACGQSFKTKEKQGDPEDCF